MNPIRYVKHAPVLPGDTCYLCKKPLNSKHKIIYQINIHPDGSFNAVHEHCYPTSNITIL